MYTTRHRHCLERKVPQSLQLLRLVVHICLWGIRNFCWDTIRSVHFSPWQDTRSLHTAFLVPAATSMQCIIRNVNDDLHFPSNRLVLLAPRDRTSRRCQIPERSTGHHSGPYVDWEFWLLGTCRLQLCTTLKTFLNINQHNRWLMYFIIYVLARLCVHPFWIPSVPLVGHNIYRDSDWTELSWL